MKLSRKRRRELRRLRKEAQHLLEQQRVVLGHAGEVITHAGTQARRLSDEHLAPRVDESLEAIRPALDRGVSTARRAADNVRRATAPFVASALARTVETLDQLDNPKASKQVRKFGERSGYLKKKSSVGSIVAISLGLAAAVGVGYALWQAFRTDDELWVAPEN